MRAWLLFSIPLGLVLSLSGNDGGGPARTAGREGLPLLTEAINTNLQGVWAEAGVSPAPRVSDLAFSRRLWLDLLGTIPSLQEIRALEARPAEGRRQWLIDTAMSDLRFEDVLAERLARIAVGGPMAKQDDLTYRRRRLVAWLRGQVHKNRPYDALVRDLVSAEGLSTDKPATNFYVSQDRDALKLAARTTRAFLGIRIDCAQCHDHPFTKWTQSDFEGLAAWFARTENTVGGVKDNLEEGELELTTPLVGDAAELTALAEQGEATALSGSIAPIETRVIPPAVPFAKELLPEDSHRRRAFAAWLTHRENPFFAKAIVNRVWQWLMGRGLVEPIDELDTTRPRNRALLTLLAEDFAAHGSDLKRLVRAIVGSEAYALDSRVPDGTDEDEAVEIWAAYPLKAMRSDQLASAAIQSGSLWTHNAKRAPALRFIRFAVMGDFTERHGDDLDLEEAEPETLLQRLHLLNGKTVSELTEDEALFGPVSRLPLLSRSDEEAIDAAFLMTLTRRPSPAQRELFAARLAACKDEKGKPDGKARAKVMADLLWALLNTTEFAWAH